MDEEARRFDVELFADVLADQDQVPSALAAGAGLGFVAMFDARQFRRQAVAAAALVLTRRPCRLLLFQFGDDRRAVFVAGFNEQVALFGRQRFVLATETNAFVVREFEDELLDLQIAPFEFGVTFGDLVL